MIITLPLLLYDTFSITIQTALSTLLLTKLLFFFFFDVSGDNENSRNLISHDFSIDNFLRFMSCLPDTEIIFFSSLPDYNFHFPRSIIKCYYFPDLENDTFFLIFHDANDKKDIFSRENRLREM